MKYENTVLDEVLSNEEWKTPTQIKRETEKLVKKSINWYSIRFILEKLLQEKRVEKVDSENTTRWRKVKKK